MKRALLRLCAAAILFATASLAGAQGAPGFRVGFAGGATFPVEDTKDIYDTGYHGSLMFLINFPAVPVGFRFEGVYARMNEQSLPGSSGRVEIGGGTANLVLGPRLLLVKPYFIGGAGVYRLKFTHNGSFAFEDTQTPQFGFNVGGGIAFSLGPAATLFLEARYTRVDTDVNPLVGSHLPFVPVTLGLVF